VFQETLSSARISEEREPVVPNEVEQFVFDQLAFDVLQCNFCGRESMNEVPYCAVRWQYCLAEGKGAKV